MKIALDAFKKTVRALFRIMAFEMFEVIDAILPRVLL